MRRNNVHVKLIDQLTTKNVHDNFFCKWLKLAFSGMVDIIYSMKRDKPMAAVGRYENSDLPQPMYKNTN